LPTPSARPAAGPVDLVLGDRPDGSTIGYGVPGCRSGATIEELDPVVLTESMPGEPLKPGDVGWIVMIHGSGAGYEVEFVTLAGETVTVVTAPASAVRPVAPKEIAHARAVA
jgi:hypothetical protein